MAKPKRRNTAAVKAIAKKLKARAEASVQPLPVQPSPSKELESASESELSDQELHYEESEEEIEDDGEDLMAGIAHAVENIPPATSKLHVDAGIPGKQRRAKAVVAQRPPTSEEVRQLNNSTDLFRTNLFELQMAELLREAQLPYAKLEVLHTVLTQIKSTLENVKPHEEMSVAEAAKKLNQKTGVEVPFPPEVPPPNAKLIMKMEPPSRMNVVGSFPLKYAARTRHGYNLDMIVDMPAQLFQKQDNINYRYFYKRAYYLATLAAQLRESPLGKVLDIRFHALRGDQRRPVLLITSLVSSPSTFNFTNTGATIRILPSLPMDAIQTTRLLPSRSGVRVGFLESPNYILTADTSQELLPTPIYNALILEDMMFTAHLTYVHQVIQDCPGFADACILAKVWLSQRGYHSTHPTTRQFTSFNWAMLLAYLVQISSGPNGTRLLSKQFTPYQLFRGTLHFFGTHDFAKQPLSFVSDLPNLLEFQTHSEAVMVDPSGKLNLFQGLSQPELQYLQHEARQAVQWIDDPRCDHFFDLFLTLVHDEVLQFDHSFVIPRANVRSKRHTVEASIDVPCPLEFNRRQLWDIITRGLSDRARLVVVERPERPSWPVTGFSKKSKVADNEFLPLKMGLLLNSAECNRLVDRGPSPQDEETYKAFQALWGSKCELRRFKDTSIVGALVWDCDKVDDRGLVVPQMVRYLLKQHFRDQTPIFDYPLGRLYRLIRPALRFELGNPEGSFLPAVKEFQELERNIRGLDDLPMAISNIYSIAPELRYTSVDPPQPSASWNITDKLRDNYITPMEVNVQFETSSQWPADLVAVQKLKTALYLKIAELFQAHHPQFSCQVCSESVGESQGAIFVNGHLDILTPKGFAFRLRIHHDDEGQLLHQVVADSQREIPEDGQAAVHRALEKYEELFVRRPWHHGKIHTLCQTYPSLSQTIRLTKRWLNSHWLSGQRIPEEAVELLAAAVYLQPAPWSVPSSGITGFHRVMDLLMRYRWHEEPLVVDIDGDMDRHVRHQVMSEFKPLRNRTVAKLNAAHKKTQRTGSQDQFPTSGDEAVMYMATVKDTQSRWWTMQEPRKVTLLRLQTLAEATLDSARKAVVLPGSVASPLVARMFTTPTDDYDFIIHIKSIVNPRSWQQRSSALLLPNEKAWVAQLQQEKLKITLQERGPTKYKNLQHLANKSHQSRTIFEQFIGFDPIHDFVNDLQKLYRHTLLFFYDGLGGKMVGALWLPSVNTPQPLKASLDLNTAPIQGSPTDTNSSNSASKSHILVRVNQPAVLAEIERLGKDMIDHIQVLS
ncbi:U3 snoRNP protein [Dispira simplex]|nr:U3 snoRNP protein [Dispira simplex]